MKFSSIPNTENTDGMVKTLKLAENLDILLTEMNLFTPVLPCDLFFFLHYLALYQDWEYFHADYAWNTVVNNTIILEEYNIIKKEEKKG